MGTATNSKMVIRRRNAELLKEYVRHAIIVVLPSVHQYFLMLLTERETERTRLDKLRAGAQNSEDSHLGAGLRFRV